MKKRTKISQQDIDRWIEQGLGQGRGESYRPWFHVRDVPSSGRSHRIPSLRVNRIHHLLSDLEYAYFLHAERDQRVVDIREQYALLPRAATIACAKKLGVRHPRHSYTGVPIVMTSDLLVTRRDSKGKLEHIALCVKYVGSLKKKRTLEKIEIERKYWQSKNVRFVVATETTITRQLVTNLAWLRHGLDRSSPATGKYDSAVVDLAREHLYREKLASLVHKIIRRTGLTKNDAYRALKRLIWTGRIDVDLRLPLGPVHPLVLKSAT